MRRNVLAGIIACLLVLLASIQIVMDYLNEKRQNNNEAEVVKKFEYCIFIEVEDKILFLLQDGKCIKQYPIASGKSGYPSPLGFWKIIEKGDWGEGFGGRWMGLNVPWGTFPKYGN